jgi:hypothetical protein
MMERRRIINDPGLFSRYARHDHGDDRALPG